MQMRALNKCGHSNMLSAIENRLYGLFDHRQIAIDVFDLTVASSPECDASARRPAS